MSAQYDNREITILESKGILVKDQNYQVVLTNRRIILTAYSDKKQRSVDLREVQNIELDTNNSGDPVIIVSALSGGGEIKKLILQFANKNFPDSLQVRSVWASEINTRIRPTVQFTPAIPPKVSPGITANKGPSPQAFCVKCGTKFVDGSVFCNRCGTKIIYPVHPLPTVQGVDIQEQGDDIILDDVTTPGIPKRSIERAPNKISFSNAGDANTRKKIPIIASLQKETRVDISDAGDANTGETVPVVASLHNEPREEISFADDSNTKEKVPVIASLQKETRVDISDADYANTGESVPVIASLPEDPREEISSPTGSGKRKPAVIAVSVLVGVIIVIAAFLVVLPSLSPGFNLTSPGMNVTIPEPGVAASATDPLVTTTTIATTTGPSAPATTIPTTTTDLVNITPGATTNGTPATTVQTSTTGVPAVSPSLTPAPGDPSTVLVSYPSLFNAGNSAGLSALLSENMKLYSSQVDSELATARSNGYIIENIQVTNKIIEEDSAILEVDISWIVAGSAVTSRPRFFLVYENNQWKLDSLVVSPDVS